MYNRICIIVVGTGSIIRGGNTNNDLAVIRSDFKGGDWSRDESKSSKTVGIKSKCMYERILSFELKQVKEQAE